MSPASDTVWCGERKGRRASKSNAARKQSGYAVNLRSLDGFLKSQRRQYSGKSFREHRLSGAGRTDHQNIVTAGGGHFERALGAGLATDISEIR